MLHITNWNAFYENASSKNFDRLQYVLIPNRFDGSKYTELIANKNGPERYAAWILLLITASRCGKFGQRGYLRRSDGTPHDAASLARITRAPQSLFEDAIPELLRIGWLEEIA